MSREDLVDRRLDGEATTIDQSPDHADGAVDAPAGNARPPTVLLVSTFSWPPPVASPSPSARPGSWSTPSDRRTASSTASVRCAVTTLGVVRPLAAIRRAIVECDPDLAIPSDDPSRQAFNRAYAAADPGNPGGGRRPPAWCGRSDLRETYDQICSRTALMEIAATHGSARRRPSGDECGRGEVVAAGPQRSGCVNTDGSWGGRGVEMVEDADDVAAAWHRLTTPPNTARFLKRLVVDRSPWPLRDRLKGRRPAVGIQAFVPGRPANVAVACIDGEVLAAVSAEVVVSSSASDRRDRPRC